MTTAVDVESTRPPLETLTVDLQTTRQSSKITWREKVREFLQQSLGNIFGMNAGTENAGSGPSFTELPYECSQGTTVV